tara:strand:- start:1653 stop:2288 length:636 start_codon:yes stop_codon:yes gene_type:complete
MSDKSRKKLAWAKNLKDKHNPNDDKKTPQPLAKKLIDMTPLKANDTVLDGFAGDDAFYAQYPKNVHKHWCEIKRGVDFFTHKTKVDWVGPTNPPYSKINEVFKHSIQIANKGIAFLIGIMNITPKRLHMLESGGFGITHMHIAQVTGWFGKSLYIVAQKNKSSILTYDPVSYRMPPDEDTEYKKKMKTYQEKYYKQNFKEKMKAFRKSQKK